jgi:LAO/AO transport system kinase
LGRALSLIENGDGDGRRLLEALYPETGRARVIGVTGPPGAGKSTLVERLARRCRSRGETVAVLAVDPTSSLTGGAILGDRVRMQDLDGDRGIFIRSMATRGTLGGLARAAHDAVDLLDAAGFDRIFVETVGVGQGEVDVAYAADTVVVVAVPGLGDDVQAIKAGLTEIADVFVVNKADKEGALAVRADLEQLLALEGGSDPALRPPILETVAVEDRGTAELLSALDRRRELLAARSVLARRRRERLRLRVLDLLRERFLTRVQGAGLEGAVESAWAAGTDPYAVADHLARAVFREEPPS